MAATTTDMKVVSWQTSTVSYETIEMLVAKFAYWELPPLDMVMVGKQVSQTEMHIVGCRLGFNVRGKKDEWEVS